MNPPKTLLACVAVVAICLVLSSQPMAANSERVIEASKVLVIKDAPEAYTAYIDLFMVIQPHPDHEVEKFINDARAGDADAFAYFCFLVWRGYGGVIEDKLAGKFGLIRAKNDGSADAAFYISQTFFQSPAETDDEKLDNAIAGLQWLGISAAMGSEKSHDHAMKYIRDSAKGNDEIAKGLTKYYNKGLAAGAESNYQPDP